MSNFDRKRIGDRKTKREIERSSLVNEDLVNEDKILRDNFLENEENYNFQPKSPKNRKKSLFKGIPGLGGNLPKVRLPGGGEVTSEMAKLSQKMADSAAELGQEMVKRSKEVAKSATELTQGVTKSALEQGKAAQQEAIGFIGKNIEKKQQNIGKKLEENQGAKEATAKAHINQINIEEIEDYLDEIWDKFPHESSHQIAQRFIRQQVMEVSKASAVFSVVPGKIAETVGIDYVSIALRQSQIVFQIAGAYEFDLWMPERKKEAFAILDRVLRASRQGIIAASFSQMIPLAGTFVNVGIDAFLVYRIGDTAVRFYESLRKEMTAGETFKTFVEETEKRYKQGLW